MAQKDLVNRKQITLTLDNDVIAHLKKQNIETGMPISRYIDNLVKEAIKRECNIENAEKKQ